MLHPLRLHYAPDNASLCVRLALGEMGLEYETTLVDRHRNGQSAPEYLRLNPNGLIPTLETPDGPIFETGAILLWLADRTGQLMPAPLVPGRGAALKWLFWLSNTLHPAERMLFYPEKYASPALAPDLQRTTGDRIRALFQLLEAEADWIPGPTTILACYLAPLLRWPALYGGQAIRLDAFPGLLGFARAFEQRPAVLAAARAEGLGLTPFSAPTLPHPPEGSAT